jgi:hypothetical protein
MTTMRAETMEELDRVMDLLTDPKSYKTPIIMLNKNGDEVVGFESWHHYDHEVWTLSDAFEYLIKTEDIIVPSSYAEYRAASALETYARDRYYRAMNYKDKKMDAWLGEYKVD